MESEVPIAEIEVIPDDSPRDQSESADQTKIKEEIPAKNEIDELSKEIALEMRHEPMTLQPQEYILHLL